MSAKRIFIRSDRFETAKKILRQGGDDLAAIFAASLSKYFRVQIKGIENIPKVGGAIIIANHSGYTGADVVVLASQIHKSTGRSPRILAHRGYFEWSSILRFISQRYNLVKATYENGVELLKQGEVVMIFPEGESGNFKSSLKMYQLQTFHTGFLRMAMETHVPVIPCLIMGAEESHLNLGSIHMKSWPVDLRLPVPLNLIPFPARWKIVFLSPINPADLKLNISHGPTQFIPKCQEIRKQMQEALMDELHQRGSIFFETERGKSSLASV